MVSRLTPEELSKAYELAIEGGAKGISLFNASSTTDKHWRKLQKTIFKT
jgi:hypothetical protein